MCCVWQSVKKCTLCYYYKANQYKEKCYNLYTFNCDRIVQSCCWWSDSLFNLVYVDLGACFDKGHCEINASFSQTNLKSCGKSIGIFVMEVLSLYAFKVIINKSILDLISC